MSALSSYVPAEFQVTFNIFRPVQSRGTKGGQVESAFTLIGTALLAGPSKVGGGQAERAWGQRTESEFELLTDVEPGLSGGGGIKRNDVIKLTEKDYVDTYLEVQRVQSFNAQIDILECTNTKQRPDVP